MKKPSEKLTALREKGAGKAEIQQQEQKVKRDEAAREKAEKGREAYRETVQGVSETAHPFSAEDDTPPDSAQTEKNPEEKAEESENAAEPFNRR